MIPVYVSNGAFITRYNGRDYHLTARYAPELHADGLEFLMYQVWDSETDALRRFLKGTSLSFPVMHVDKHIGEILAQDGCNGREEAFRLFTRDIITANEIGARKLVMHLWSGPYSDAQFAYSMTLLPEMYEICEKHGLLLTVENVTCKENICLDHLAEIANAYPFARFTYDTKMAYLHGENSLLEDKKYRWLLKNTAHLHINDSASGDIGGGRSPILHIGDGEIDFDAFFGLLRCESYNGTATVESTSVLEDGSVNIEKLNRSLDRVRRELNS